MKHVIIAVFVAIAGASTAYSQRKYADPIPQPHKFPDPCDNPTVKRWGPWIRREISITSHLRRYSML